MTDIAHRFPQNPLLRPEDVRPSRPDLEVKCLLNPGAFQYRGQTGLLIRVAEAPITKQDTVSTVVIDPNHDEMQVIEYRKDDPLLVATDPRGFTYNGKGYLTTLSHLRLAWSDDGIHFTADDAPAITGAGYLETFGIEDCRVTQIEDRYLLTYTQVSPAGHGVGLIETTDWHSYTRHGMIIPPLNKDCAIFPERVGGVYCALHRPSGWSNDIWVASSPDGIHWGDHRRVIGPRPDAWDSERVGAGAQPIRTDTGWLEIYHGADHASRYCLGALLLDTEDPSRVLARSTQPIMEPTATYETKGFFGNVVFTNGHIVDGDRVTVYYGASDNYVCGATFSIQAILKSLTTEPNP